MRKETALKLYTVILFGMYTMCIFVIANIYIKTSTANAVVVEPEIIEKEVIVYVDREPEPVEDIKNEEPVATEESPVVEAPQEVDPLVIQPINTNFDVFKPSNVTKEQLTAAIGNGPRSRMLSFVDAFIDAEQTYGVNAIYLVSTIGLESGWGKHRAATNNVAGWKNGSGGYRSFETEYDCIMTVASGLANSFKSDVGHTLGAVTRRYCPEGDYATKVMQIMREIQGGINE